MGEQPSLAPVPGLVYLMRPVGLPHPPRPQATPVAGPDLLGPAADDPAARETLRNQVARLLTAWLEAFDGRRPVAALRNGPFTVGTVEQLQRQIRADHRGTLPRPGTPSRLLRVHLPPAHRGRPAFMGSVLIHDRVRALVGCLGRHGPHWLIDELTLL
ncbi:Rv3235 family protein [Corynebacterium nuruki]|uniref:Rv3235 family protein n=1 Tax=Corynebacterium nuruki TaxID=1032851 RepID=UPI000248614A|nr:Rv3235 family protein [Corynebacterium nuruki]